MASIHNRRHSEWQNGFRAGYRTRRPLFVALVDATNAFPSTNQDTLWLRLVELGMGGRHENVTSEEFKSLIGLLTGDPASPTLWNLYMSSLKMPPDKDDVVLGGVAMDMLAQADDILLLSLSARGLQRKLDALSVWCSSHVFCGA